MNIISILNSNSEQSINIKNKDEHNKDSYDKQMSLIVSSIEEKLQDFKEKDVTGCFSMT